MLDGTEDPTLIRALSDLAHWLLATKDLDTISSLPHTTEAWLAHISRVEDTEQANYAIRLELPESVNDNSNQKKVWHCHPESPLPKTVAPISPDEEAHIIHTLITEANEKIASGLSAAVNMSQISISPQKAIPNAIEHLEVVGGIHASGIVEAARSEEIKTTIVDISLDSKTKNKRNNPKNRTDQKGHEHDCETVLFVYQLFNGTTFRDQNNKLPARGLHIWGMVKVSKKKTLRKQ